MLLERQTDNPPIANNDSQSALLLEPPYGLLFHAMQEGVAYCKMLFVDGQPHDFVYLTVNEAFCRLTGLHDVAGKRVSDLIPGIQRTNPELFKIYGRVARTGVPEKVDTFVPGLRQWFCISVYGLQKDNFVAIFYLTTDQRRATEQLQRSERIRHLAHEAAKCGSWEWDLSTDKNDWSDELWKVYGLEPYSCEPSYQAWMQTIHPDDRAFTERAVTEAAQCGTELRCEWRVVDRDKTCRWLMARGQPVRNETGTVVRYIGVTTDVTEIKHNEQAVRENAERLRGILDVLPVGICVLDNDRRIVEANPAVQEILEISHAELCNAQHTRRTYMRSDGSPMPSDEFASVRAAREGRLVKHVETGVITESGKTIWTMVSAAPLPGGGAVAATVDITEQRHTQAEKEKLRAQLVQAQKMECIGALAGGIAHDFNNLLAAMTLNLNGMQTRCAQTHPELRDDIDELVTVTKRASELTQQLLAFGRRQVMTTAQHDLNAIVGNFEKMLRRVLREDIELVIEPSPSPQWVDGDAGMLQQVLMNLCVNARDAIPRAGKIIIATGEIDIDPRVAASRGSSASTGKFVFVRVSDTGMGLKPEHLERIFEPFFTTKAVGKGTGLGLSMVHGIVAQHQGFVEVSSRVNKGTTFNVYLPRCERRPSKAPVVVAKTSGEGYAGRARILLVEDEAVLRRVAQKCLQRFGHEVVVAANASEAIGTWEREEGRFDLLLTDMVMPGGQSGLDLCRTLRERKNALRVVLMSGHSPDLAQGEGFSSEEVTFLSKPFDVQSLTGAVHACLAG